MTLKKLQLFYFFYLFFILATATVFFLAFSESTTVQEDPNQNLYYGVSIIFSLSILFISNMLFNKSRNEALTQLDSTQQEQIYAKGCLIRLAMIEGALIYNLIFAFVIHLTPLVYLVAALFLYIIYLYPSQDRFKKDLNKYN